MTFSILAKTVAKLFVNNGLETKWMYTRLWGLLCLIADAKLKTALFRLYDITLTHVLFECEIYIDLVYLYSRLGD
jgi:hypothetical protein